MPKHTPETRDRRAFLTQLATGSVALAGGGLATHVSAPAANAEPITHPEGFSEAWLGR